MATPHIIFLGPSSFAKALSLEQELCIEDSIRLRETPNEFCSIVENSDTITLKPPTEIICGKAVDYDQESLINESYEVSLTSSVYGEDNADVDACITNIDPDMPHHNTSDSSDNKVGLRTIFHAHNKLLL